MKRHERAELTSRSGYREAQLGLEQLEVPKAWQKLEFLLEICWKIPFALPSGQQCKYRTILVVWRFSNKNVLLRFTMKHDVWNFAVRWSSLSSW